MLGQFTLTPIEANTKGTIKRLRKSGSIPVSIQRKGTTTLHFQQKTQPIEEFIRQYGDGALLELAMPPEALRRVMVKHVQRDPLTHKLTQVIYMQIQKDDLLKTHVPIAFSGEPIEVTHGDVMVQHQIDRLDIVCSQDNLPGQIVIDISNLHPGDVIRVMDLPADSRYKILTAPDTVLASLTSTRAALSAKEAETEAAETPA